MSRIVSRPAYSLIELAVVMTVASTLMVVAVGWIQQSMKFGSIVRTRQTHHQNLLRLGSQFRDDVHRGDAMNIDTENQLVIELENSLQVVYAITSASVSRTQRDGDRITARDAFPLAPTTVVRWDTSEIPATIALIVDRSRGIVVPPQEVSETELDPRPVDLYVRASVGRYDLASRAKP